jgi:hypothetical protein
MNNTPTPETDSRTYVPSIGASTVPADFSRKLEQERDEARKWQNVKITKNGETHCLGTLIELLERENAKLRNIAERAINYLDQAYRDGFADEVSDLRYEIEQLKEETK